MVGQLAERLHLKNVQLICAHSKIDVLIKKGEQIKFPLHLKDRGCCFKVKSELLQLKYMMDVCFGV